MTRIAVTMRVDVVEPHAERRDALDQRWHRFLAACNIVALPVPNHGASALAVLDLAYGLLLSGGNDLVSLGGTMAERDATEHALLDAAIAKGLPVMGVCRGMQLLASRFNCVLARVDSHVGQRHPVRRSDGSHDVVNSFHCHGIVAVDASMEALATAADGSIEAFRHVTRPIRGTMWHPEREDSPRPDDVALFRGFFGAHG